jgi:hypothetical protein
MTRIEGDVGGFNEKADLRFLKHHYYPRRSSSTVISGRKPARMGTPK